MTSRSEYKGLRLRPVAVKLLKLAALGPLYAQSRGVQEIIRKFYSPEQAMVEWRRHSSARHYKTSLVQQIEQGYTMLAFARLRRIGFLDSDNNGRKFWTITERGLAALEHQPWKRNRWHKGAEDRPEETS